MASKSKRPFPNVMKISENAGQESARAKGARRWKPVGKDVSTATKQVKPERWGSVQSCGGMASSCTRNAESRKTLANKTIRPKGEDGCRLDESTKTGSSAMGVA